MYIDESSLKLLAMVANFMQRSCYFYGMRYSNKQQNAISLINKTPIKRVKHIKYYNN